MPLHQSRHRRSRSVQHLFVPDWAKRRAVELGRLPSIRQRETPGQQSLLIVSWQQAHVTETPTLVRPPLKRVFPFSLIFLPPLVPTNCHMPGPTFCLCFRPFQQFDALIASDHLLFPRPSEQTEDCVSLFFTPLVSAQPQARGNCPHVCCWTANGVKEYSLPLLLFLF